MFKGEKEALYICINLSTYIKSGIPLSRALSLIRETLKNKKFKESLLKIEKRVSRGESLSKAFSGDTLYPSLMRDMIKIGEESGELDKTLEKCAENMISEIEVKNKIKKALTYPLFLFVMLIVMIFVYLTYILPQFIELYDLNEIEGSKILSIINEYILFLDKNYNAEFIIFTYFLCFLIFLYLCFKLLNFKGLLEKVNIYKMYYEIRILFIINMILNSGVSLNRALGIFENNLSDFQLRNYIKIINRDLVNGKTLSESVGNIPVISKVSKGFLVTGEESGLFNENLKVLLNIREKDFESLLNSFINKMEPIIFLLLGGVITIMMLLILIPTFEGMKYA